MDNEVQELRDALSKLDELKSTRSSKKEEMMKSAMEHRSADKASEGLQIIADGEKALDELDKQIAEAQTRCDELKTKAEKRSNEDKKKMNEIMNGETRSDDKTNSIEYRKAFMEFACRNVANPILETRADSTTTTTTAPTVIPTTLMNEILRELKVRGNILSKVRQLNVKGGVEFPVSTLTPVATWIGETTTSDRQHLASGKISFSYYGLECKISQSILSSIVSLDSFEAEFATLATEAMVDAIEIAILNGTGSGQPTGIFTNAEIKTSEITSANLVKYDKLKKALSGLSISYQVGAELFMAKGTWDTIDGMVDANGQPVARTNYGINGTNSYSLFGFNVNLVEENRIKSIDSATSGEFIMLLGNMKKYAVNTNGNMGVIKYRDNDKNEDVTKALMVVDGKVLEAYAFLGVKLGA